MKISVLYGLILLLIFSCSGQSEIAKYTSMDDLNGKKVGVMIGSTYDLHLTKHYPGINIQRYESDSDLPLVLLEGRCQAIASDYNTLKILQEKYTNIAILVETLIIDTLGVGFRLDNTVLRDKFNVFLKEIRANGVYDAMEERWMNNSSTSVMPELNIPTQGELIRAATVLSAPPHAFLSHGVQSGFDIELLLRFAENQQRPITILNLNFNGVISAIASNRVDIISSGITITEERAKSIAFSDPHYLSKSSVAILDIHSANYDPSSSSVNDAKETTFFEKIKFSFHNNIIAEKRYMQILKGLLATVIISILSTILGTIFGAIICFMRMSRNKAINRFAQTYITIIRGIPVLVLLMLMYYVVFSNTTINAIMVAVITFALNLAAYVSEMFRSAIESVDHGQTEAGVALGFTPTQTFINIVMPQAIKSVIPVYKGEIISLIKMTSVVGYVAVEDLTKASDLIRSRTFDAFFPLVMVAIIYFFIAWAFSLLLDYYNHKNYSEL